MQHHHQASLSRFKRFMWAALVGAVLVLGFALTGAAETAHPLGFPTPKSSVAHEITDLYNFIFWIISAVAVVVAVPLMIIMVKYRRKANPNPAKFSHSTTMELIWTIIPAIICVVIAYESYKSMVYIREIPAEGMVVEAVAYQFGWDFYYPDFSENGENVAARAPLEPHPTLSIPGSERFVKEFLVPVDTVVKLHVTASDVIHAFYAPDLGMKVDAIPGRLNYLWFRADETGEYIGQCAELCGSAHGEMFFTVKVVERDEFETYINTMRADVGLEPVTTEQVAAIINAPTDEPAVGVIEAKRAEVADTNNAADTSSL